MEPRRTSGIVLANGQRKLYDRPHPRCHREPARDDHIYWLTARLVISCPVCAGRGQLPTLDRFDKARAAIILTEAGYSRRKVGTMLGLPASTVQFLLKRSSEQRRQR